MASTKTIAMLLVAQHVNYSYIYVLLCVQNVRVNDICMFQHFAAIAHEATLDS